MSNSSIATAISQSPIVRFDFVRFVRSRLFHLPFFWKQPEEGKKDTQINFILFSRSQRINSPILCDAIVKSSFFLFVRFDRWKYQVYTVKQQRIGSGCVVGIQS